MHKTASHKENKYSIYISLLPNISNVLVLESSDIKFDIETTNGKYSLIFAGLSEHKMPIVFLCNPEEGSTKKPHRQYLKKKELLHLCLSVRDDISVRNIDYKKIIDYTLSRVTNLLNMSEREEEREYRKEFLHFWNIASVNKNKVQLYINSYKECKNLKIYKNKDERLIVTNEDITFNKDFVHKLLEEKDSGLYLPISNIGNILPPFEGEKWEVDKLKYVLTECITEPNIEKIEQHYIEGDIVYLVFEMNLPDILPINFMLKLKFNHKRKENLFEKLLGVTSIEHLSSLRCDTEYLFKRIGINPTIGENKVLVVGAGSLGSYILAELPKIGINDITIFDYDTYSIENHLRHRLDSIYTGNNKAFIMAFNLMINYPQISVNHYNEMFSDERLQSYNLESYDLILIATGGTDYMLNLNKQLSALKIKTPVIFAWIEPNGIAVHSLVVDYSKKGCFKCLYSGGEGNKAHFQNNQEKKYLTGNGCGGVFNSYGNLTLLKGTAMIIEVIQMYLNNKIKFPFNPLYSVTTLSYQSSPYVTLSKRNCSDDKSFYIDEGCDICGHKV